MRGSSLFPGEARSLLRRRLPQSALRYIRRSLELAPHDSEGLRVLAIVSKILGRPGEAVNAAQSAVDRAPQTPGLWNGLGDALLCAHRYSEAIAALRQAMRLKPGYIAVLERLERAHAGLGDLASAVRIRESRLKTEGQNERANVLTREAAAAGPEQALAADNRRAVRELIDSAETVDAFEQYFSTRSLADRIVTAYADLGAWKEAMDWVERAYERRPGRLRRMLTDFPLDRRGLATDSRYIGIMTMAGADDLI